MVYRHYRLQVISRIALLAFTLYLSFYLYFQTQFHVFTLMLALFSAFQTWALVNYVQRTNRMLTNFFDTLKSADFADRLVNHYTDCGFHELSIALNQIIATHAGILSGKEQQLRFFKSVFQKIGIGLIVIKPGGSINFINRAAERMLKVAHISHMRQLDQIDGDLAASLLAIKSGQRKWISVNDGTQRAQLVIYAQEIQLPKQGGYKLLTLQNMLPEFEEKESDAWKDLIRVLSHEIMNSMTPISSLATTASSIISKDSELQNENRTDLYDAIEAISKRSRGLMKFVQNYRQFASIPLPRKEPFAVQRLFERIHALINTQLTERSITIDFSVNPSNLYLYVDPSLIEQVLLNILSNSMDAVAHTSNPQIQLKGYADSQARVSIQTTDNGKGIDDALFGKIFIPFFSTKSQGSGVGLSISRQIMRLHGGTVRIHSICDQGTTVTLVF